MNNRKLELFPFLLVFFEMATYLSSDMYLPALPQVMREFAISHQQVQWTLTSWFLGSISVQLILGPLADHYGRKKVLCWGGIIFILASFACAVATAYPCLLVARFIQGSGIGFMAVPGYASIHESYRQREAIKIIALMGSVAVLAPAFGPLLGSVILLTLNWRWIFGFLVLWSTVAVGLLIVWMPETLAPEKRLPLELAAAQRSYWKIISNSQFIGLTSLNGLIFCGFITWIVAGPFLVIDWFQQSPMKFSIYQTLIFFSLIFGNYLVKKYVAAMKLVTIIRLGLGICCSVSFLSVLLSLYYPQRMAIIIMTYIIYAFGSAFLFSPLNRLSIESSAEAMGSRMAVYSSLLSGFGALSSILVGAFYKGPIVTLALLLFILMSVALVVHKILF
jgi:DHA1 family multidrug/chloramphenicol efflux transport protein-like MFS transporter